MADKIDGEKKAVVLGVTNEKGGVGKTTTTAALVASLGARGYRVAAIDCDPKADLSSQFGIKKLSTEQKLKGTSADLFQLKAAPHEIAIETQFKGVYLVPSSVALAEIEMNLPGKSGSDLRLSTAIEESKSHFDVIFLDSPPNPGKLVINIINASDWLLLPVDGTWGLSALDTIVGLAKENSKIYKLPPHHFGVILTRTAKTQIWSAVREEAKSRFPEYLFQAEIRDSTIAQQASAMQVPLPFYATSSGVAKDYVQLTDELLSRMAI